jgi:hypothetical protein
MINGLRNRNKATRHKGNEASREQRNTGESGKAKAESKYSCKQIQAKAESLKAKANTGASEIQAKAECKYRRKRKDI